MLSLHQCLFTLLLVSTLTGIKCQELTPVNPEESSLEDSTVTLSYRYSKQATGSDDFFWYRQYPGKPPEFLLYISGNNFTRLAESLKTDRRFFADLTEEKHRVDVQISSAAVTDSAVYYCALQKNQGQEKLYFGKGTKLTIQTKEEHEPSFYKLGEGDTEVCLATGFTRFNLLQNDTFFNETKSVRISEDSVYNQVAYLTGRDDSSCNEEESAAQCVETLEPDPMVNLMFLTTFGLRILFIKTIIFNVLMTLRLWISQ